METLITCLTNWKTTLIGFVAGIALYVVANGVKMPTDAQGWWTFAFAALVAGLGFVCKDATTGSRPKMVLVPLLALLTLTGCAGIGGPAIANMSPEQLYEIAKIKDASVTCFAGTYAGARVNWLNINADKGVPAGVQIDTDCKASFLSGSRPVVP